MEQTGEGDELAVAEEILRTELRELRIVVALGLGGDVEIGNEEGLGQIAVTVGKFLGRVARRNGHEFVVPRAVGGEAAYFEALVALFELTVAQNVRAGGAGIGLVVLQSAEILVLEEDVLKASVEEQAVVARTEGAGREIGRGEEYVRGGIARSSDTKVPFCSTTGVLGVLLGSSVPQPVSVAASRAAGSSALVREVNCIGKMKIVYG